MSGGKAIWTSKLGKIKILILSEAWYDWDAGWEEAEADEDR